MLGFMKAFLGFALPNLARCVAMRLVDARKMLGSALIVVVIFGWPKSRTKKHNWRTEIWML